MNENLNVSKSGLELITKEEGVVLKVYKDPVGLLTVGVGHLLTESEKASGKFNGGITREQAIALLKVDVMKTENIIKKYVKVELNQNQFDALASMIFNTGGGPLITGTLGKLLNAGKFEEAAVEMLKWCHAGGQKLPLLLRRRKTEAALFSKPVQSVLAEIPVVVELQPVPVPVPDPTPQPVAPPTNIFKKVVDLAQKFFGKK